MVLARPVWDYNMHLPRKKITPFHNPEKHEKREHEFGSRLEIRILADFLVTDNQTVYCLTN
jgi:hypothetical protein